MGGSQSSASTTIDTTLATKILSQAIMNCASSSLVAQTFLISGNYNVVKNTKQVQAVQFNTSCQQTAQNTADLQQQLTTALSQAAEATGSGVTSVLGASSSDVTSVIKQDVETSITQQTIQNIVQSCVTQQNITISGNNNIVDTFSQEQTMSIVQSNCQNAINSLKTVQTLNNEVSQKSTAVTTNPISDIINSVGGLLTGIGMIWAAIAIAAIVAMAYVGPGLLRAYMGEQSNVQASEETAAPAGTA